MFTKADYHNYFEQIARVERRMAHGVYDLANQIDDAAIVRALQKIGDDEIRHYGYVLKMLKLTSEPGQFEKRREAREYSLGTVLLQNPQDQITKEIKACCVNLSKTGICLECAEELPTGGAWGLKIQLLGRDQDIVRQGKVLWSKKVDADFYISGIEFEP